ncbi:hypothetical protein [Curtobacterium sp. MR_MD2014]|uniref:hypothetical protein n=1 Tax=Curtobacterium sp. MR_MD2014 TaxID=1561023 RepID=UPI000A69BB21|nr:hypothetical protein [Curtobacterium sp. MR_MD2014]
MVGETAQAVAGARPVTVRGGVIAPIAWTALCAGVLALGVWLASTRLVFGGAWFTQLWTSGLVLVAGVLGLYLSIGSIRNRIRVFPDRLEVVPHMRRTVTISPGELVGFSASGPGNTTIRGRTARGRGFSTDRFRRHHDVLVRWLEQNATEPWTAFTTFFGKLTVDREPRRVRNALFTLFSVAFFLTTLSMFPGLPVMIAYDDAHQEQVTCTITSARAVTVSNRSLKGVGSSHPAVSLETTDCGHLTLSRGIFADNRDAVARRYDRAPGPYRLTVGGGGFWLWQHASVPVPEPTVYSVDEPATGAPTG